MKLFRLANLFASLGVIWWTLQFDFFTALFIHGIFHYVLQIVFAWLNMRRMERISLLPVESKTIGIQVVGWKENEEYFTLCLQSLKNVYEHKPGGVVENILCVVDGNEKSDAYMGEIFKKTLPGSTVLNLDRPLLDLEENERNKVLDYCRKKHSVNPYICILQPHGGKRIAMYTALWLLKQYNDCVMVADSDTLIDQNAPTEMLRVISQGADAATGNIKILNLDNLLSLLVDIKYWFAFNLERAAQSYFSVVTCVSGPLGMYRSNTIDKVLDKWVGQTCCGSPTTFGDDRHLTNLVLAEGGKIEYTQKSFAYTDTPTSWTKWISQQTRWCRSFLRENILGLFWMYKHPWWLAYDCLYTLLYAYVILYNVVNIALEGNFHSVFLFLTSVAVVAAIRGLVGVAMSGEWEMLYFTLYGYIYLCFLTPMKIWSLISMHLTDWGTGSRMNATYQIIDQAVVAGWNIFLWYCIGTTLSTHVATYDEEFVSGWLYMYIACAFICSSLILFYPTAISKRKEVLGRFLDRIVPTIDIKVL